MKNKETEMLILLLNKKEIKDEMLLKEIVEYLNAVKLKHKNNIVIIELIK